MAANQPFPPAINYPSSGSTVFNRRPRLLLTVGATNDGPKHILCVNDGSEKTTANNGSNFSCGTEDALASEQKVVYRSPSDYATGSKSISARGYDSALYSASVSRFFIVTSLSFTDPDLSISGTPIKAIHITQLQTAISTLRAAYGLPAYSYISVMSGLTPIGNASIITDLQTALQAVVSRINSWDTSHVYLDVVWINPAATGGGVDRVKLRQAIEQMRSIILDI